MRMHTRAHAPTPVLTQLEVVSPLLNYPFIRILLVALTTSLLYSYYLCTCLLALSYELCEKGACFVHLVSSPLPSRVLRKEHNLAVFVE